MRVLESKTGSSSAFGVMDAFAALRSGAGSDPAFGGYLLLKPRTLSRRRVRASSLLVATARRIGALMAVILVSGLGVAAIANCECDFAGAGTPRLARLAYAKQAPLVAQDITESGIFAAMVIEPAEAEDALVDASPITTAAITPLSETPRPLAAPRRGARHLPVRGSYDWLSAGDALPPKIEPMKDAGAKPLRVAAAAPADDGPGVTLPEVAPTIELHAVAVESENTEPERTVRKHHSWKRLSKRAKASSGSSSASNASSTVASGTGPLAQKRRMPRWAQQMYDNPWQSKAFAYVR